MARRVAGLVVVAVIACVHSRTSSPPAATVEFTPIPEMEAVHAPNPHDYRGKPLCQRCHVRGERGMGRDPIALCSQCHDASAMKHPYGVPQPGAPGAPADLKFGANGTIVCHTCHDPHDVKAHKSGLRFEYVPLCKRCHVRHSRPQPSS